MQRRCMRRTAFALEYPASSLPSPLWSRSRLRGSRKAGRGEQCRDGPAFGGDALCGSILYPTHTSLPAHTWVLVLISSSTANSSLHECKGLLVPSCLAAHPATQRRRSSLGPEAGHARVCRPQPLFMHLISLHRLRGLASGQSFPEAASLVREEGSPSRRSSTPPACHGCPRQAPLDSPGNPNCPALICPRAVEVTRQTRCHLAVAVS